ncbi:MAG: CehA/McbA family metallohydrolase [Myxococcota bacterium]
MTDIAQRPDRYLRAPRLSPAPDGGASLHVIAWQPEGERLLRFRLGPAGAPVGDPEPGPLHPGGVVALTPEDPPRPTDDVTVEHRAADGAWMARVEHADGASTVWVEREGGEPVKVWQGDGIAACPAVAAAEDGAWVAFHHDVREDTGAPDVAKWIALRFVTADGRVLEPAAEMTDRDRDRGHVEQSFEFPSLVVSPDGAVALFGRGSHNFWRQDLSDAGFGPRIALSDGEWGSRGRRVAACRLDDGGVLIARRERRAIRVDRLEPPTGGTPALRPARVAHRSPVTAGDAPRPDPAKRHGRVTLFGDIQQHSAHSDGIGCADEAYLRARFRYGDDFVALTDHESFLGKRTGPGEWQYLQRVADHHDDPGRFATLVAYEWTGKMHPGPGHKCVYFPTSGYPLVSRDELPEGKDLVARIRQLGGFASPHHIGWTGCDEAGHDEEAQPVWEICSCHGCYEHADHPLGQRGELRDQMVDAMLARGHRFGFTASSDSHGLLWHHGEARKRDPYRTGLTAVQAEDRTRAAVYRALVTRRCYATSGAKILVDLVADGQPMGSVLRANGRVDVRVEAVGETDLCSIELVGPDGVVACRRGHGPQADLEARLATPWLYARVTQCDGEMAWTSPVFVE